MDKIEFRQYMNGLSYDKYYQDIEYIDFIGYANSWKSWENIKDLVDWRGKSVIDVGCFHGYYCFKAEKAGAINVIGIDKNEETLKVTRLLASLMNSKCTFINITANDILPDTDILLCLNMFHYIPDQEAFLKTIKAQLVIFEIDKEDLPKIEKYYCIITKIDSHRPSFYTQDRPNRWVLLAKKND